MQQILSYSSAGSSHRARGSASEMLAKIEELTLHQIEQEKRMQALAGENAALRTENDQIQSRLHRLKSHGVDQETFFSL